MKQLEKLREIELFEGKSLDDIFKTINHETYHHCFSILDEADDMDEDQEERLIYCMQWAPDDLA